MTPRPTFTKALARLVPAAGRAEHARWYRPLVTGPAILVRAPAAATWTVDIACDRVLRPRTPRCAAGVDRLARLLARRGGDCRVGAAVIGPLDAPAPDAALLADEAVRLPARRLRLDIYGWALMYQPPGMRGRAVVDADDRFPDLPAVFELPLELIDRTEFMEARGFRTRPLVILTRPEDFAPGPDGRLRNRFFPEAYCRPPCGLDRLL